MEKIKTSLKAVTLIGLAAVLSIFSITGCGSPDNNDTLQTREENSEAKPNIVFIISDDHSWPDYGFMGHPHIETPNIDKLASQGLTFTRGYLVAPLCRPSLASLATGLYPHQHGVTGNDPAFEFEGQRYGQKWGQKRTQINKTITQNFQTHSTIATLLGEEGYLSFQTGKWWEGSWKDGGFTGGMTHGDPERGGRHGDEGLDIGREGMQPINDFIDKAQSKNSPFFLWYAPFMPHSPHTPPDSLLQKYMPQAPSQPVAQYWAMIDWFDLTIGQLFDKLDQEGMTENTLVVFISDNGWIQDPDQENRYMPRSKRSPYDMGIRTPIIYKWPGHINARMDTTTLVSSVDLVPTALQAAGLDPTSQMHGLNVMNGQKLNNRSAVYSEDFAHDIADVDQPTRSLQHRVVVEDPWKLILPSEANLPDEEPQLYHILNDPHEKSNVASENPEVLKTLREQLNSWWEPDF